MRAEQETALSNYGGEENAMVVNHMSKRFGRKFMAVKGLSFTVKQGKILFHDKNINMTFLLDF